MISGRTAIYGAGGALLVAYLAGANMPGADAPRIRRADPPSPPRSESLAAEVRAQASRLQTRIAAAPVPDPHPRNLFTFAPPRRAERAAPPPPPAADAPAEPAMPPPPALTLMGVAEEKIPQGVRRTAVIAGDGDALFMVSEGQPVGDRYKVTKIGADAVELEDVVTHAYRRLALR